MGLQELALLLFAPAAGIVFLLVFLSANSNMDRRLRRIFYTLLFLEAVGLGCYVMELVCATWPEPTLLRVLLSALGYSIHPFLAYLALLLTLDKEPSRKLVLVGLAPLIVNAVVAFSALWCGLAYSYDASNQFVRGPLGYTAPVVTLVFIVILVVQTIRTLHIHSPLQSVILVAVGGLIAASMAIEAFFSVRGLGYAAVVLGTIFYYMFLQTIDYQTTMDASSRIQEDLTVRSRTDDQTELLNKAAFLEETEQLLQDRSQSLALAFFDLDHFKQVNDTMGHLMGDQVLRDVADQMRQVFRRTDILGRFGGDEFCVLLPGIPYDALTHKMKEAVTAIQMEYRKDNVAVTISTSIGVVYLPAGVSATSAQLLSASDTAVYAAKHAGRNRFAIHTYTPTEEKKPAQP